MSRALMLAAALSLCACRHRPPPAEDPGVEGARAPGEVSFFGSVSRYDAARVVGPQVNLSRRPDGAWAGTLMAQPLEAFFSGAQVRSKSLSMTVTQNAAGTIVLAQHLGRILRFEITPAEVLVRTPTRSLSLKRNPDGSYGPGSELSLKGDAATGSPALPQFAFAVLASL